ncbi:MAG: hypothetical protein EP298_06230 [Gammaproteobacteria bacterium]|nr:MAG: hypothetical protein EP298_06230 [Gammaproteobacteria bacterium]UTW41558.1 hypothetical protein KFE69_08555 [bacterium SCSIO 12844]
MKFQLKSLITMSIILQASILLSGCFSSGSGDSSPSPSPTGPTSGVTLDEFNVETSSGDPVYLTFRKGSTYQVVTSAVLDQPQNNLMIDTTPPKLNTIIDFSGCSQDLDLTKTKNLVNCSPNGNNPYCIKLKLAAGDMPTVSKFYIRPDAQSGDSCAVAISANYFYRNKDGSYVSSHSINESVSYNIS